MLRCYIVGVVVTEKQNQETSLAEDDENTASSNKLVVSKDEISKAELFKGYLDTRRVSNESYLKVAQSLDQVLTVWPISIITGSVLYLRGLQTVGAKEFLIACWILESIALFSMLFSMKNCAQGYEKGMQDNDDWLNDMLNAREPSESSNPWSVASNCWENYAIWTLVVGFICFLSFVFDNLP